MLTVTKNLPPLSRSLCPGSYITDGVRLYRVVTNLIDPRTARQTAELEDCLTLDTLLYPTDSLARLPLELVRPAQPAELHGARA